MTVINMVRMMAFSAAALVALMVMSSCGNDNPVSLPLEGFGSLQGYVRSSGQPVAAQVAAILEDGEYYGVRNFSTMSDSTGWYRLDLPPGVYRVEVLSDENNISRLRSSDTIRITPRVIRFDLERCRAEITLQMPGDFDGLSFNLKLEVDEGYIQTRARQEEGVLVFEYPVILPGFFTMGLSNSRLGRPFNIRRPTAPGYDAHVWVDATAVARFELDYRDIQASISGTVSGACVEDGSRPRMIAFSADSVSVGEIYCNPDGSYKLTTLLPQPVRMKSTSGASWWIGGDSFGTAKVFDLAPTDQITGVDFAISGFRLVLEGPGNFISHQPRVLVLDDAGGVVVEDQYYGNSVSICNLRAGRYFLRVEGYCEEQTWAPQWYSGAETQGEAIPIDLAAGEYRELEMSLVSGGRISGVMVDSDGSLASIDNLGVYDIEGGNLCGDWRNSRDFIDGNFTFSGLADGSYLLGLRTWSSDYRMWWYPGTWEMTEAQPIVIEDGTEISGLSWSLPPEEGASHE